MWIDAVKAFVADIPATVREKRGVYSIEFVVAQRKAFLSKKTLTYRATFRVDEADKEVRFTEVLVESGSGAFTDDGGTGFSKETFKTKGGAREGSIEEQSKLFGKQYSYSFDFTRIRAFVESEAVQAGYAFRYQLTARGL